MSDARPTPARRGRLAFCPARFGAEIVGGAEIVLRRMAGALQARGWDVEVLTSCATDHRSWANVLPPGESIEDGLCVRRFPVVPGRDPDRGRLERRILDGERLTLAEQQQWMDGGMQVPGLAAHVAAHAAEYRAVICTPYPFWVTHACARVVPERCVLWTCLHDEPYATLPLFAPMFRDVAGLLFQSGPEHDLAHRLVPGPGALAPHAVVGCGVEVPPRYDPAGFRARHGIPGRFLLYAGRREGAKGWDELLDAFAAADASVQPSRYEAFFRTIMEAWLAGVPVVANAGSDVVAWHCRRSGGGLLYTDPAELEQHFCALAADAPAAARSAAGARDYVLRNYRWPAVLDRVEAALLAWT